MVELISTLQSWVDGAGLHLVVTDMHAYAALGAIGIIFLVGLFLIFRTTSTDTEEKIEEITEAVKAEVLKAPEVFEATEPVKTAVQKISWKDRLSKGLTQSRNDVWGRLGSLFGKGAISEDILDEIEEILYGADLGPTVTSELIEAIESEVKKGEMQESEFKNFIKKFLTEQMGSVQEKNNSDLFEFNSEDKKLKVIMIVGVNGAGKTTTIGKLATKLTGQGAKVVVGACDTFRAAAVDQLQVWCDRANATMIRAKEGANPSGVGYDALQTAMNENANYCILDTAGRLHTAGNLMEELTKSKNVLKKLDDSAPHHTLLVIDAITGQNALRQAEEFNKALALTGLIFTKCDGSSKAGSAVSIVKNLQVPITYIGVGENVEDLNQFTLNEYLDALVGN